MAASRGSWLASWLAIGDPVQRLVGQSGTGSTTSWRCPTAHRHGISRPSSDASLVRREPSQARLHPATTLRTLPPAAAAGSGSDRCSEATGAARTGTPVGPRTAWGLPPSAGLGLARRLEHRHQARGRAAGRAQEAPHPQALRNDAPVRALRPQMAAAVLVVQARPRSCFPALMPCWVFLGGQASLIQELHTTVHGRAKGCRRSYGSLPLSLCTQTPYRFHGKQHGKLGLRSIHQVADQSREEKPGVLPRIGT